jgi:UTP--glucose-1-phosphate uridylyltransferase
MNRITKAVFPLAQAMLSVMDRPLIQYAIEEAVAAGIEEMIFVTGAGAPAESPGTRAGPLGEHDLARELLGQSGLLEAIRGLVPRRVKFVLVRQPEAPGLGQAILCARAIVGEAPFAVVLPEALVDAKPALLAQMTHAFSRYGCSFVAVAEADASATQGVHGRMRYAQVGASAGAVAQVAGIIEAPRAGARDTLEIIGRFVFTPAIFHHLESLAGVSGSGPVRIADAIELLLRHEALLAFRLEGSHFDCSTKLGHLKATVAFGLAHPEIGSGLAHHLQGLAAAPALKTNTQIQ